jgi:hypothetical protein
MNNVPTHLLQSLDNWPTFTSIIIILIHLFQTLCTVGLSMANRAALCI